MDYKKRFKNQLERFNDMVENQMQDNVLDEYTYHELKQELLDSWKHLRLEHENEMRAQYGDEYHDFFDALNEELDSSVSIN